MNKAAALVFLVLLVATAAIAYSPEEALGRSFAKYLVKRELRKLYRPRAEDAEVESDSFEGACDSVKYRTDAEVQGVQTKVAAASNKIDELKKGLTELATANSAMLTGAQVTKILALFPVASKLDALKALDKYFYLIDATNAMSILRSVPASQLCTLGDFNARIVEATDPQQRSCLFSKVDSSVVIFTIDVSPSMWFKFKGVSRIDMVRKEFANMVKTLKPEQDFNIVIFGESSHAWKSANVKATPANINEAINFLNTRNQISATNINDALEYALSFVPATTKDATIFFLTDGVPSPNYGKYWKAQDIINNITNLNRKRAAPVTINTVSFLMGIQKDEESQVQESQAITKQLAANNGGIARAFSEK